MTITIAQLVDELEHAAPVGVEVPRDNLTNATRQSTIERWAKDAAGLINSRRGRTTHKEQIITTTENVQDYALASDVREVVKIDRRIDAPLTTLNLDIPTICQSTALGFGAPFGVLPSGQEIGGSLDLINRQRLVRQRREDDYELIGGKIRFVFPTETGEKVRVTYEAVDRDIASLPDDRFELVLTYLKFKNLEWLLSKYAAGSRLYDTLNPDSMATLVRQKIEFEQNWLGGLNGISAELN